MPTGSSPNEKNGTQPTVSPPPGFGLLVNYPTSGINLSTLFPTTPTTTISNTLHYRSTLASATNFGLSCFPSVIPPGVTASAPVPPVSSVSLPIPHPEVSLSYQLATNFGLSPLPAVIPPLVTASPPPPPPVSPPPIPMPEPDVIVSPAHVSPTVGTSVPPLDPSQPSFKVDFCRQNDSVWAVVPSGASYRKTYRTSDYHFFWPTFQRTFTFRTTCNCHLVSILQILADVLEVPKRGVILLDEVDVNPYNDLWSFPVKSRFTII